MSLSVYTASTFPTQEAHFLLPGPSGLLEVRTSQPTTYNNVNIGVICHPHPLMGGTMENKVVTTVARTFKQLSIPSIRFNFRGVGYSSGKYDHGKGELEDLLAIFRWLNTINDKVKIALAGFSFGSFIAASAASHWSLKDLILIAPPVERFNFQSIPTFDCPWTVIQGDQDEVVNSNAVEQWWKQRSSPGAYQVLPNAGHFFHGQLSELNQCLIQHLHRLK